jgi:hypothetical protein
MSRKWDVDVYRIVEQTATIRVEAETEDEATEKAWELADDTCGWDSGCIEDTRTMCVTEITW